ncbi:MAG TPA: hypothetical protein VJ850_09665 [Candidatus Limnocylindrales bacterium]|nr:hypothetical protein [Candidatus Limnocylindrales bacterium]
MGYRVRRRRAKADRFDLDSPEPMTLQAFHALRPQIIERWERLGRRSDIHDAFWQFEPGVPEWLRHPPPPPDTRLLLGRGEYGRNPPASLDAVEAAHRALEAEAKFDMGRADWLASQFLEE